MPFYSATAYAVGAFLARVRALPKMKETTAQSLRAVAAGIVALVLSFSLLRPAGTISAVLIRRHWPEAWFSGLIVWYFDAFAAVLSIALARVVGRTSFRGPRRSE